MNATKVANKEHEVTMKLDGQVQPLPCKVAEQINMSQVRKEAIYCEVGCYPCFVTSK